MATGEFVPAPDHNYPLPGREYGHMFTAGVWLDVHQVLVRQHGFPEMKGADLVELQQALFKFLFVETTEE